MQIRSVLPPIYMDKLLKSSEQIKDTTKLYTTSNSNKNNNNNNNNKEKEEKQNNRNTNNSRML
jgi:hypothetical protein